MTASSSPVEPPPTATATPSGPGRRELNRARTREAIVTALRSLVAELPVDMITVDHLAERAGISRRTFFNYFGGIAAVISHVFAEHASGLIRLLDPEQLLTDPVAALRAVVADRLIPADFIAWLTALNCHDTCSDSLALIERAVWADMATWLRQQLHALRPDADPLFVATLASSVMGCFEAAEQVWLDDPDRPDPGSDADVVAYHDHLDRALGLLDSGWRTDHR